MVVAAGALAHWGSPEFAAPDDQRVIEHAALFEVFEKRGRGLVGELGCGGHVLFDAAVVVPAAVVELHEADTAFEHASGEQAVGGK